MDSAPFDTLVKSFAHTGTRRGLLRLLAALPLSLALSAHLGDAREVIAKGDVHGSSGRRRRKAKHRHQAGNNIVTRKGQRKGRRKGKSGNPPSQSSVAPTGCTPDSVIQTCASTCGQVANNCGTIIDCGSCDCDPPCHPTCQTCNPGTGRCENMTGDIACDDGNLCTVGDTCRAGICAAGSSVSCATPSECQQLPGACDPTTGDCTYANHAAGTVCAAVECGSCDGNGTCGGCQGSQDCLPNGTCATRCTKAASCGCSSITLAANDVLYCRGAETCSGCCLSISDCERGQFCTMDRRCVRA
jgi:hypothetical protein